MHLGSLLREERVRLGMTQAAFAEACGVAKRAQIHYESDERVPSATYLSAAAALGVDVNYLLTGAREIQSDPDEARLLAAYRVASDEVKRVVLAALGAADRAPGASTRTVIKGSNIGQQVSGDVTMPSAQFNVGGTGKKGKS